MDKTKQYSQCCAIPRCQPYMEKVGTKLRKKALLYHSQIPAIYAENMDKLNKIVSVVPFPDSGHIRRKYGRQL